ncbi:thiamine pyrophosphokinase [Seinonella peptonophila]|uniref:Thiamine diphosphokinase n=1 Tax=Seinonella peptonophila TaxID=112248 RepID=A0A1M4UVG1_9BACL|nr:thiamine diphosphokinase [Seinonella peptonophila]SHE60627.1 thiamine pyrophosphokinase [Seinonella peptonophila]
MKKRIVIVAGGELSSIDVKRIQSDDKIIAVDGGAESLLQEGIIPTEVVGDFDTLSLTDQQKLKELEVSMVILPSEKDMSDTQYAIEIACDQSDELLLLGLWGGPRIDHALANLYLLEMVAARGCHAIMYHNHNRIQLCQGPTKLTFLRNQFHYLSLIPISPELKGVTNQGLKYPLKDATLYRSDSRGISNEWVDDVAGVEWTSGTCLIIESAGDQKNSVR